jgi:rare lipoprotein A
MIVVRINDRGPYGNDRVISLSRASADRLNTSNNTKVRIDPIIVAPDGSLSGPGMACTTVAKQTYALPARPNLDGDNGAAMSQPAQTDVHAISNSTLKPEDSTGAPVNSGGFLGAPTPLNSGVLEGSEPVVQTAPGAVQNGGTCRRRRNACRSGQRQRRFRRAGRRRQRSGPRAAVSAASEPAIFRPGRVTQNGAVWRIQLGPFSSKAQASTIQQRLQSEAQLQSFITRAN